MAPHWPELWILRHGQTVWNAEGRLQGHLDSPLTDRGQRQARAQGEILRRVLPAEVTVLSSPAGRSWQTAEIALAGLGLVPVAEPDLREVHLGRWQGRLVRALRAERGLGPQDDPHLWKFGAPGGERLEAVTARLLRLRGRLEGPCVLFTHGLTSRVLRCLVLGRPLEELSRLPGGQGVVHHVTRGVARVIDR